MTVAAGIALIIGAAFVAIASLGLVRLPDVYLRMHSLAKAGTLGCGVLLVGVALAQPEIGVVLRVLGVTLFLAVTAPVASHLLGRAAHRAGAAQWEGTLVDEWAEDDTRIAAENRASDLVDRPPRSADESGPAMATAAIAAAD